MSQPKNQFGIPQFARGDARRLFVLLTAIELLERPTIHAISDMTGCDTDEIEDAIGQLREQFGVEVARVGEVYHLEGWGEVLNKEGVRGVLRL